MSNKLLKKHYNGHCLYRVIPDPYILTLQTDGNGTLTADKITGYAGDTVTLTPTNNTYYRFKNYQSTGGSIVDNKFTFGDSDATAMAYFSANTFTASGSFETAQYINGSYTGLFSGNAGNSYALTTYHTDNVPASWFSTNNRWNPSNANAYSITLNGYGGSARVEGFGGNGSNVTLKLFNNSTQVSSTSYACTGHIGAFTLGLKYNNSASDKQGSWYTTFSYYIAGQSTVPTQAKVRAASGLNWTATGYAP